VRSHLASSFSWHAGSLDGLKRPLDGRFPAGSPIPISAALSRTAASAAASPALTDTRAASERGHLHMIAASAAKDEAEMKDRLLARSWARARWSMTSPGYGGIVARIHCVYAPESAFTSSFEQSGDHAASRKGPRAPITPEWTPLSREGSTTSFRRHRPSPLP
jgi:hypothetical protein